jgi:hypothetical protein
MIAGGKRCPAYRFAASIVIRAAYPLPPAWQPPLAPT